MSQSANSVDVVMEVGEKTDSETQASGKRSRIDEPSGPEKEAELGAQEKALDTLKDSGARAGACVIKGKAERYAFFGEGCEEKSASARAAAAAAYLRAKVRNDEYFTGGITTKGGDWRGKGHRGSRRGA